MAACKEVYPALMVPDNMTSHCMHDLVWLNRQNLFLTAPGRGGNHLTSLILEDGDEKDNGASPASYFEEDRKRDLLSSPVSSLSLSFLILN